MLELGQGLRLSVLQCKTLLFKVVFMPPPRILSGACLVFDQEHGPLLALTHHQTGEVG